MHSKFIGAAALAITLVAPMAHAEEAVKVAAATAAGTEAVAKPAKADDAVVSETKTAAAASAATVAVSETVAPKAKPKAVAPSLKITINLNKQRLTVTENGKTKHTWKISSGRRGYRTVTGTFRPKWMTRMHYSRKYDNAPMPHSIFFHGGYAIHATYATGRLGRPASHGCVRLSPGNAKKLYRLVSKHGKGRTRISVFGTAPYGSSKVARKKKTSHKYVGNSYNASARKKTVYRAKKKYTATYSLGGSSSKYTWPGDAPKYRPRYGRY